MSKRQDGKRQDGGQHDLVTKFVNFLDSGHGFDDLWPDLRGIVTDFAGRSLVKAGVKASYAADEWAVHDVVHETALLLVRLANQDAKGRFDPAKAKPGLSGLRAWLWRVVQTQAVNWARAHRGGRSVKVIVESSLPLNALSSGQEGGSLFDRQVAKVERPDLLPILQWCIDQLADPFMRDILRLKLNDGLSERATADRLHTSVSTVHRRLHDAYPLMAKLLRSRGIDESWFDAIAA